jgi:hypothetical protein
MRLVQEIDKTLSANDAGETGGHQAGILVPKIPDILDFFPSLDRTTKNPRRRLAFVDESGVEWHFVFIYYNNKFFGGTRNEYRLTHMTDYIRSQRLSAGDHLRLGRTAAGGYSIKFVRARPAPRKDGVLQLGTGWVVVSFEGKQ